MRTQLKAMDNVIALDREKEQRDNRFGGPSGLFQSVADKGGGGARGPRRVG